MVSVLVFVAILGLLLLVTSIGVVGLAQWTRSRGTKPAGWHEREDEKWSGAGPKSPAR